MKRFRPLLIAVGIVLVPCVAQAGSTTAADRATARQLMFEGRNLRYDKDLKGALEKFRAADALMGVPTTGIELARTQAALGMLVEALDTCARVIRHPIAPGEPAPFREARKEAKELRAQLRKRTPYLRFVFPAGEDPDRVELLVDGIVIPKAARRTPRLVNPGKHEVQVIAGQYRHTIPVAAEEGETQEVVLVLPQRDRTEPGPVVDEGGPNPWVWGGVATAAVGGAIGGVAGVLAWSERNKLDDACPDRACPSDEADRIDRAHTYANVSTYAFIAGGIGAAVGLGALWSSSGKEKDADVGAQVVPCGGATLCVNGRF